MAPKNFTPIDDLVKKWKGSSYSLPKEAEPMPRPSETLAVQESVEHEVPPEVKAYVQPRHETIKLPPDLSKLGLQPVPSAKFSSYKNIKLPITDEKVVEGLHQPISSSKRWLSEFAMYLLRQAHLTLKVVGGKVVRVIKLD